MLSRRLLAAAVFLALAPAAFADRARDLAEAAAEAIQALESAVFNAEFKGVGSREGRVIHAQGRILARRAPGDPLGAHLFVDAVVEKPMMGASLERMSWTGETVRRLDFESGTVQGHGGVGEGGERYLGFSSVLWRHGELLGSTRLLDYLKGAESIVMEPDSEIHGVACDVIRLVRAERADIILHLGREDHLPRKLEYLTPEDEAPGASVLTVSALMTNIDIPDTAFMLGPDITGLELDGARVFSLKDGQVPAGINTTVIKKGDGEQTRQAAPSPGLLEAGEIAPDFTLPTPEGGERSLADYRGKVVVLDFWATWCAPCLMAMPALQSIHEAYPSESVAVVGVATLDTGDPVAKMEEKGFTYELLLKGESIMQAYGATGLPTLYVIGPDGEVLHAKRGFAPGFDDAVREAIDGALGATPN